MSEEIIVAGVALAISVIALAAAALQVTQQYYASANGYNACDRRVMGHWSRSRTRRLKLKEFRFEVQYEAPVIFLTRPDYTGKGPVDGRPVIMLKGDAESRAKSWTEEDASVPATNNGAANNLSRKEKKAEDEARKQKESDSIHTADNDLATWVTLLNTIQSMESISRAWQDKWYMESPPRPGFGPTEGQKKAAQNEQTLVVSMQKKLKSYDTMPAGIKKPYATTTWCHMIELTAMLGIYWVEFDRTSDRYRAEGNGFVVSGDKVSDLGVMFSFQVARNCRFEENRVIPSEHVKDLAFGMVSTVYFRPSATDDRRLNKSDRQDISKLYFSSRAEIAESLVLIGCNANAVNYFAREDHKNKRVTHLFPLAFEIIGMLSKTFHIEHSGFRYLPNPTMYTWNNKNFSLRDILFGYMDQMDRHVAIDRYPRSNIIRVLTRHGKTILHYIGGETTTGWPSFILLNALHDALRDTDVILTGMPPSERPKMPSREATQYSADMVSVAQAGQTNRTNRTVASQDKIKVASPETQQQKGRRKLVQDVLRSHIQEVLSGLNQPSATSDPQSGVCIVPSPGSPDDKPRFEDIDSATPEEKQGKLMQVYFQVIRVNVIKNAQDSARKRRESVATVTTRHPFLGGGLKRRTTAKKVAEEDTEPGPEGHIDNAADVTEQGTSGLSSEEDTLSELSQSEASAEDIWCTLVFRMICWLMLHDFDQMDVQKPKKELHGSRLRVYIA